MEIDRKISFSFGENWQNYLKCVSEDQVAGARSDIVEWLGKESLAGRRILDIGSGSGIHSLVFHGLGAASVLSFDVDPQSVAATSSLWEQIGKPRNWDVQQGSILDPDLVESLRSPGFDLVYSWGVLHHTGNMWQAIENAIRLIADDGLMWIALYVKGPRYEKDLALKQAYNRTGTFGKKVLYLRYSVREILKLLFFRRFGDAKKILFPKSHYRKRGMSIYYDIIDWLGGLPYEVASPSEVVEFTRKRGLILEKIEIGPQGGNHLFLFSAPAATAHLRS